VVRQAVVVGKPALPSFAYAAS